MPAVQRNVVRYTAYLKAGAELYNRVDVGDFEYMEKLGEGAYGKVVSTLAEALAPPTS